ncbi:hypothetical protein D4Z77_08785, partial [Campylobacter coli]
RLRGVLAPRIGLLDVEALDAVGVDQIDGGRRELRLGLQPVVHVLHLERLQVHVRGGDAGGLVFVHDRLGIVLGRVAVERHVHDRFLQLGRELRAQRPEQFDRLGVRHQVRAVGVEVGPEGGVALLVVLGRGGGRVGR